MVAMAPAQAAAACASVSLAALYVIWPGVIQIGESAECGFLCAWVFAVAISAKFSIPLL